jgi:hypothetical protein
LFIILFFIVFIFFFFVFFILFLLLLFFVYVITPLPTFDYLVTPPSTIGNFLVFSILSVPFVLLLSFIFFFLHTFINPSLVTPRGVDAHSSSILFFLEPSVGDGLLSGA